MTKKKALLIALPLVLALALALVLSYDTLAAYFTSLSETSEPIYAKTVNFHINGSESRSLTLDSLTIGPDSGDSWQLVLDARGSEVPVDAQLALGISWSGTWPKGLTMSVNGQTVDPAAGAQLTFTDIQNTSPQAVDIAFYWDVASNADFYKGSSGGKGGKKHIWDWIWDWYWDGHDNGNHNGWYKDKNGSELDLSAYEGFSLSAAVTVDVTQSGN